MVCRSHPLVATAGPAYRLEHGLHVFASTGTQHPRRFRDCRPYLLALVARPAGEFVGRPGFRPLALSVVARHPDAVACYFSSCCGLLRDVCFSSRCSLLFDPSSFAQPLTRQLSRSPWASWPRASFMRGATVRLSQELIQLHKLNEIQIRHRHPWCGS